ncbi:hypothetical protein [Nonomuraea sp. NPDC050783]|uniref:hypothetical protein n=1 Tax=Nonomuraea sp. NPDC050783 TaxID=3154634 RepID=UPI003465A81F
MIPEGHTGGQGWRAALALLAFAVTAVAVYGLFASGFGRLPPPGARPATPSAALAPDSPAPAGAAAGAPARERPALAVVTAGFWLTYLPPGLRRSGGGTIGADPDATGGWARFGTPGRYVEAWVEHGAVAADWPRYRSHVRVLDARAVTVHGRPAVAGRDPRGGRVLAWLERAGTGARIRVSESLGKELLAVAASARAPVGD